MNTTMTMARGAALVAMLMVAAGCSGGGQNTGWCSASTCAGCCNGEVCEGGTEPTACGTNGAACTNCASCTAGVCDVGGTGGGAGVGGGMGATCVAPLVACGTECVDTRSDPNHCGTCTSVCTSGCSNSACSTLPTDCTATPCPSLGYYCDLGSKQCKQGCVLDTQCSGPLNKCDTATRTCGCQTASCGAASYCTAARTCAAGCEQSGQCSGQTNTCNVSTHACVCSANSCPAGSFCGANGACATGCAANTQCTAANENVCNTSSHACQCNAGFHKCGTACVSNTSINSCGNSCTPCAAPPAHAAAACTGGACGFTCDDGYFKLGSACFLKATVNQTSNSSYEINCAIDSGGDTLCSKYIGNPTPDLVTLAASYNVICATSKNGAVLCAGPDNLAGELGLGQTVTASSSFQPLMGMPATMVKVAHAEHRGFALSATGELYRWGMGWQTNSGSNPWAVQPAQTPIAWGTGFKDFGLGEQYVCVILAASPEFVRCTGGYSGSGGSYTTKFFDAPAGVTLEKVAYGYTHGCAIDTLGKVYCWGRATGGQLGYASTSVSDLPMTVVPNFPPAGRKAIAIATNSFTNSCALLDDGRLFCWGAMGAGNVATPTPTHVRTSETFTNISNNREKMCPSGAFSCFDP